MREIFLTQGKVTFVDDGDYDWLNRWKWHAHKRKGNFYAARQSSKKKGKQFAIQMHRQILGLEREDKREVDHIAHNTLDNRRDSIRICTHVQNMRNQKLQTNLTSQFKGVCWKKQAKKWVAQITIGGEVKHLGYWEIEEVAALRYDMVAIREHGKFACLNFN